jgi:hypothetical protein
MTQSSYTKALLVVILVFVWTNVWADLEPVYADWDAYFRLKVEAGVGSRATFESIPSPIVPDDKFSPVSGLLTIQLKASSDSPDALKKPKTFEAFVMLLERPISFVEPTPISCLKRPLQKAEVRIDQESPVALDVSCTEEWMKLSGYKFQVNESLLQQMQKGQELRMIFVFQTGEAILARLKLNTFNDAYSRLSLQPVAPKPLVYRFWKTGEKVTDANEYFRLDGKSK